MENDWLIDFEMFRHICGTRASAKALHSERPLLRTTQIQNRPSPLRHVLRPRHGIGERTCPVRAERRAPTLDLPRRACTMHRRSHGALLLLLPRAEAALTRAIAATSAPAHALLQQHWVHHSNAMCTWPRRCVSEAMVTIAVVAGLRCHNDLLELCSHDLTRGGDRLRCPTWFDSSTPPMSCR